MCHVYDSCSFQRAIGIRTVLDPSERIWTYYVHLKKTHPSIWVNASLTKVICVLSDTMVPCLALKAVGWVSNGIAWIVGSTTGLTTVYHISIAYQLPQWLGHLFGRAEHMTYRDPFSTLCVSNMQQKRRKRTPLELPKLL